MLLVVPGWVQECTAPDAVFCAVMNYRGQKFPFTEHFHVPGIRLGHKVYDFLRSSLCEVDFVIPILQMRKWKLKKVQ